MKKPIYKSLALHLLLIGVFIGRIVYRHSHPLADAGTVNVTLSEVVTQAPAVLNEKSKVTTTKESQNYNSRSEMQKNINDNSEIQESISSDYLTKLQQIISANQFYPRSAILRGQEGLVKLKVSLGKDGILSACEVLASSGFATLDDAAVATIQRIGKLPLPSSDVQSAVIEIPIRYQLQR